MSTWPQYGVKDFVEDAEAVLDNVKQGKKTPRQAVDDLNEVVKRMWEDETVIELELPKAEGISEKTAAFDLAVLYAALLADPNVIKFSGAIVQLFLGVSLINSQGRLYSFKINDQPTLQGNGVTPAVVAQTIGVNALIVPA